MDERVSLEVTLKRPVEVSEVKQGWRLGLAAASRGGPQSREDDWPRAVIGSSSWRQGEQEDLCARFPRLLRGSTMTLDASLDWHWHWRATGKPATDD